MKKLLGRCPETNQNVYSHQGQDGLCNIQREDGMYLDGDFDYDSSVWNSFGWELYEHQLYVPDESGLLHEALKVFENARHLRVSFAFKSYKNSLMRINWLKDGF